jgi:alpha-D-ribose 1-methylphosphonate 5-triphosphate synthase subunit PhnG
MIVYTTRQFAMEGEMAVQSVEQQQGGRAGPSPLAMPDLQARRAMMATCAEATPAELDDVLASLAPVPAIEDLRAPETGLVMVRGRAGGEGSPFNLGEASVVRAAVRLDGVGTGFAYHLGRDVGRARAAAAIDALWQSPERQSSVEAALVPIRTRLDRQRRDAANRTAATRVDFFTMVRGED